MKIAILILYTLVVGYASGGIGDFQMLNSLQTQILYLLPAYLLFSMSVISRNPYRLLRGRKIIDADLKALTGSFVIMQLTYILCDNGLYIFRARQVPLILYNLQLYLLYLILVILMFTTIILVCYTFFNWSNSKILSICLTIILSYIIYILDARFPINFYLFNFIESVETFANAITPSAFIIQVAIDGIAIYLLLEINIKLIETGDIL